jgi:hypothetical protein
VSAPIKLNTTGKLREYLATALVETKEGKLDLDKARAIAKMAAQINDSFYSEIKLMEVQLHLGKEVATTQIGKMVIGEL